MNRFILSAMKRVKRPVLQPFLPRINLRLLQEKRVDLRRYLDMFSEGPNGFKKFKRVRKSKNGSKAGASQAGKSRETVEEPQVKDQKEAVEEPKEAPKEASRDHEERKSRKEAEESKKGDEAKNDKEEDSDNSEDTQEKPEKDMTPEERAREFRRQIQEEFENIFKKNQGSSSRTGKGRKTKKRTHRNNNKRNKDSKKDNSYNMFPGGGIGGGGSFNLLRPFLVLFILLTLFGNQSGEVSREEIAFEYFENEFLKKGLIKSLLVERGLYSGTPKYSVNFSHDGKNYRTFIPNVDHFLQRLEDLQKERGIAEKDYIKVDFYHKLSEHKRNENASVVSSTALNLFLIGFILFLAYSTGRGMRNALSNLNKQNRSGDEVLKKEGLIKPSADIDIRFKDVAGMEEAKKEITEFVEFLKKPEKYHRLGAQIPKGALLTGPPGTGKTMLAKACAKEAEVPFFYMSGSEFVERYVGVGASRVRKLFELAKKESPSIIFIDEIDAIGGKRSSGPGGFGNPERENTLNQLLVELDGFATDQNVVLFGATNMKDSLDPALLRPGRFDRSIDITLPDIDAREKIFGVHLGNIKISEEKSLEEYARRLATLTPGFSGAEIANICNEAAIIAARAKEDSVTSHDFEMAVERVIGGLEKKRIVSEEERKVVAIHESGHGVVSWFLEGGLPLLKLTIIPRSKGALGFAQYLPNETQLDKKSDLVDRLCSILGGRIAEEILLGRVTTGASDDLEKVHDLAHQIVTKFGMGSNLKPMHYKEDEYGNKSYSDKTARIIDIEKQRLIDECSEKTRKLVEEYKDKIVELSDALLKHETLDFKKIYAILGDKPFETKDNFKRYLEEVIQTEEQPEAQ